jgi:hypothetical protein
LGRVFGFFGVLVFVMKRDRFERQDGFAGLIHWFNVFLKSARRIHRAELAGGVDQHWYRVSVCCCYAPNISDKAAVVYVSA